MRVQCTQCGAAGNVRSSDPNKTFQCPSCGGAMRAGAPPGPAAPNASGRTRPARSTAPKPPRRPRPRRRKRRRIPIVPIVVWTLAAAAVGVGIYYLVMLGKEPGSGAKALGLLPGSTLAAVSIEKVDRLERDLPALDNALRKRLIAAVGVFRQRAERWLQDGLGISHNQAAAIAAATTALGFGVVPAGDEGPAVVTLLVLKDPAPADDVLGNEVPHAEDVGGVAIHHAKLFAARFGDTLALCRSDKPLRAMASSFGSEGAGSLGQNEAFREAREELCRKGRAWFWAVKGATQPCAQLLSVAGVSQAPIDTVKAFLPTIGSAAGTVELAGKSVIARATVQLPSKAPRYDQVRLPAAKLAVLEFIPADADLAVAVSLGDPRSAYDRLFPLIDAQVEAAHDQSLRSLIRRFESRGEKLYIRADVVPELGTEAGLYVSRGEPPRQAIILNVARPLAAQALMHRLATKLSAAKPNAAVYDGLTVWTAGGRSSLKYAFVENMLVLAHDAASLQAVRKARKSGSSLAKNQPFRNAAADLPKEASALLLVRESPVAQRIRHASGASWAVISLAMNKTEISVAASLPDFAETLLSLAVTDGRAEPPRKPKEDADAKTKRPGPAKDDRAEKAPK